MTRLEGELLALKQQVVEMGVLAESMVTASCEAIATPSPQIIERVRAGEPRLDDFQIAVDREAIRLITVYSPAARDLRFVLMMARINSELERIGDQAVNTCEYVELLRSHPPIRPLDELSRMAAVCQRMLHDALRAFREDDVQTAETVMRLDDEIDAMNAQVVRDVLERRIADHDMVTRSMGLLVARSIERIADHATNICEEVFYVVKGEDIRHQTA